VHVVDQPNALSQLEDLLIIIIFVLEQVAPDDQFLETGYFADAFNLVELVELVVTQVEGMQFAQRLDSGGLRKPVLA
jgi:hypothetical protein